MALRSRLRIGAFAVLSTTTFVVTLLSPAPPASAEVALTDCVNHDNGDPALTALTFTPHRLDVRSSAKQVRFTAKVKDSGGPGSASGVEQVLAFLISVDRFQDTYSVRLRKVAGGSWVGTLTIPRGVAPGRFDARIEILDRAGNPYAVQGSDLAGLGFDDHATVKSTVDSRAPSLSDLKLTPVLVDTRSRGGAVAVAASVKDGNAGVSSVAVSASQVGGAHQAHANLRLSSGGSNGGVWSGRLRVPRWVGDGTWRIDTIAIVDSVGNAATVTYADLASAGIRRTFRVTSGTDRTLPSIDGLTRSPEKVNVLVADKQVTIGLTAKDKLSGVASVRVEFDSLNGFVAAANLHRTTGTINRGVWEGAAKVRRCFAEAGGWQAQVKITDRAGNVNIYQAADLGALGFPDFIMVKAGDHIFPTATVANGTDVPWAGPVNIDFSEDVTNISTTTVSFGRDGSWACTDGSDSTTSCLTGAVRHASFTPAFDFDNGANYSFLINPAGTLGVTDLSGNPFDRSFYSFRIHYES